MKHLYQIKLINTATGNARIMSWTYTSLKEAQAAADKWNSLGEPYAAEVIQYK